MALQVKTGSMAALPCVAGERMESISLCSFLAFGRRQSSWPPTRFSTQASAD